MPQPPQVPSFVPAEIATLFPALPRPEHVAGPLLVPRSDPAAPPAPVFATPLQVLDAAAPKLTREEEIFAISLTDLAEGTLGREAAVLISGGDAHTPTRTHGHTAYASQSRNSHYSLSFVEFSNTL